MYTAFVLSFLETNVISVMFPFKVNFDEIFEGFIPRSDYLYRVIQRRYLTAHARPYDLNVFFGPRAEAVMANGSFEEVERLCYCMAN
jgi:hypothetical protein